MMPSQLRKEKSKSGDPPFRLRPKILKELQKIEKEVREGKNLSRPMKDATDPHSFLQKSL